MNVMNYAKMPVFIGVLGISVAFLVGCSSVASNTDSSEVVARDGTTFEGAWAAEFAREYERTSGQEVREILSDGQIADAELQSTTESFRSCLEQLGITIVDFSSPTEITYKAPKSLGGAAREDELVTACLDETGQEVVSYLYKATRENPTNKDEQEDYVACLIRLGAVSPDFTVRDYQSALPRDWYTVPEEEGDVALDKCYADPKGAR
ncbi:hypothetical protein ICL81_01640 [Leucobacter sp. cx-328]|uniref:hypothetical protein n=1 Tax=unclassified Leucobacter TaxID=2621730 RepID=UPI00165DAE4E|nr:MULTISPECIES: hypothetical protein [unclassified Leucobacter]MBC9943232.1 hypothetical protein [Leucobacter sp. cx-328]